jgi:hypothetical protein
MDIVEFARPNTVGPIRLYLNTTNPGGALSFDATVDLAPSVENISGAVAVDYDWDGDLDILYVHSTIGASLASLATIENLNEVPDGTSLHLRILDHEGFNVFYGNTVQLFDSRGRLVSTQILNPQSGVGTNDGTGVVHFYNLSPHETYTVALVRSVNGASQDVSGVSGLAGGAGALETVEVVNRTWTGLRPGASNSAYVLVAESDGAANAGIFAGTGYNDTFFGSEGDDTFRGGGGWAIPVAGPSSWSETGGMDIVDYGLATGPVTVNLVTGTASGQGNDVLQDIEGIRATSYDDTLIGDAEDNLFEGRGGNDEIDLSAGGHDVVQYRLIDPADPTGGNGTDTVIGFTVAPVTGNPDADVLDLRELLKGYRGTASVYWDAGANAYVLENASRGLLQFLNVVQESGNTLINIDLSGTSSFTTVAQLQGVETTLEELLGNGQLWVGSSSTMRDVGVNALVTNDDTPVVTGTLARPLEADQELRVTIDGVTYSNSNLNEVVIDPVHHTWYVQVAAPLAEGTYDVVASVWNGDATLAMQDMSSNEITVVSPLVDLGGAPHEVNGTNGDDELYGSEFDDVLEGGGGNDLIHLESAYLDGLGDGGQDTVLFRLLDALDATGGNGTDTISGFKVAMYEATPGADRIDLSELLIGYTADADGAAHYVNGVATLDPGETIGSYLQVTQVGGDTLISIDRDGAGGDFGFWGIAILQGITTDLETLLANHQIVVA